MPSEIAAPTTVIGCSSASPRRPASVVGSDSTPSWRSTVGAVVVDPLAEHAVVLVEGEDRAEGEFEVTAGGGEAAPGTAVGSGDEDLEDDSRGRSRGGS